MIVKSEVPGLMLLPPMPDVIWQTICHFSAGQNDAALRYLDSVLNGHEPNIPSWLIGFDFCRLTASQTLLSQLTERYATTFNRPPPDWITQPVEQAVFTQNKGHVLNILSVSNPESDQYVTMFNSCSDKRHAVLLKFTPGRTLSWQETAVQRLARGIEAMQKIKVPVYLESPDTVLVHINKIPPELRTDSDWSVLFYFLLYTDQEQVFEDEALQYTLAKGISPPSFEALNYAPIKMWFDTGASATEEEGTHITLQGALSNHIGSLITRITQRLQRQETVTLDLRGVSHADWSSVFDIAATHKKIWASGSRKLFIIRPSPLLHKMFECAGISDRSFVAAV